MLSAENNWVSAAENRWIAKLVKGATKKKMTDMSRITTILERREIHKTMKKIIPFLPLLALACSLTTQTVQAPNKTRHEVSPAQVVPTQTETCTIAALKTLNLREAAGTSSAVIAILEHGEIVTILPHPDQGTWIRVRTLNNEGWINSNYCTRRTNHE
jgi:uncharacterized protein YgiM (DUF1202 family)